MNNVWEERPKIDIPKTKGEKIWDVLGYISFATMLVIMVLIWNDLTEQVPGHFNASGEVDRWGSKYELFLLPSIGLFLLLMMKLFEKHPEWHNYPKRINENNVRQFYLVSRTLVNRLKNLSLIMFSIIQINIITTSLGYQDGLGPWFLPVFIVVILLPVIFGTVKIYRIK